MKKINLNNNNLDGSVNMDIFSTLIEMTELSISDNPKAQFSFTSLPKDLTSLTRLTLGNITLADGLVGIESLNAAVFKGLDVSNNGIEGTIPDYLYTIQNMDILYLDRNKLTGTISPNIGQLASLSSLDLYGNSLEGTLPSEISTLKSMKYFEVSVNNLSGAVPWDGINNHWEKLKGLYMHHNSFSGPLGDLSLPTNVHELDLGHNQFSGTIPLRLLQNAVASPTDWVTIHLEHNQLTGSVPENFSRFEKLDLRLENNKIGVSKNHFSCSVIVAREFFM